MMHWPYFNDYCEKVFDKLKLVEPWAVENAVEMLRKSNFVFTCGNGGSANAASHFTQDLMKACGIKSICLNDSISLMTALANDIRYDVIYSTQLAQLVSPGDTLFVISGSGNSSNILHALATANTKKAWTVALTGFDGGLAAKLADVNITVPLNDMKRVESAHSLLLHFLIDRLSLNES